MSSHCSRSTSSVTLRAFPVLSQHGITGAAKGRNERVRTKKLSALEGALLRSTIVLPSNAQQPISITTTETIAMIFNVRNPGCFYGSTMIFPFIPRLS